MEVGPVVTEPSPTRVREDVVPRRVRQGLDGRSKVVLHARACCDDRTGAPLRYPLLRSSGEQLGLDLDAWETLAGLQNPSDAVGDALMLAIISDNLGFDARIEVSE